MLIKRKEIMLLDIAEGISNFQTRKKSDLRFIPKNSLLFDDQPLKMYTCD